MRLIHTTACYGDRIGLILEENGTKVFVREAIRDMEVMLTEGKFVLFDGTSVRANDKVILSTLAKWHNGMLVMLNGHDHGFCLAMSDLNVGQTAMVVSAEAIAREFPLSHRVVATRQAEDATA